MLNKEEYENALKIMCNGCDVASNGDCDGFNMACYAYKPLKELVEKATPKKMEKIDNYESFSYYKCSVCHSIVGSTHKYCSNCGQRIDTIVGDVDEYE